MRCHLSLALLSIAFTPTALAQAPGAPAATPDAPAATPDAPAATPDAPAATPSPPAAAPKPAPPLAPVPAELSAPAAGHSAPGPAAPAPHPASASAATRVAQPKPLPPREVDIPDVEPLAPPAAPIPSVAAWLGINTLWLPSAGFDAFAEDDALTLFDLGAAVAIAGSSDLDVAAVVSWGVAGSSADYRAQQASLDVMRFSAGPELRGSIIDRLYWHGRLSPTATRLAAGLDEASSGATLADTQWAFGLDAALGLDLRFAEASTPLATALGFFVRVEAGYAWSQAVDLELGADGGDAPVRTESLTLPELALGGPSLRASVGAGF